MNIDVLKTFCDLVDSGSFSKAAEANLVSQSAVSQQLAKLEREMGTQLVARGGGIVIPTEAGKSLYEGSRDILRRYEQTMGEIRSASDAVRGILRVGTIYSLGFYLLDPYVRAFLREHPEVNLRVEYTHWNRIYAEVISGEMDLGVVAYPEKQRSIDVTPLAQEELVMVCSPTHRLAGRKIISPSAIEGEPFLAFGENIPTRRHIDRQLKVARVNVDISMQFDNAELLKRAVEINSGVTILPRGNVEREVARGDLSCSAFSGKQKWLRDVGVIRRRGKMPSQPERLFLGLLRNKVK